MLMESGQCSVVSSFEICHNNRTLRLRVQRMSESSWGHIGISRLNSAELCVLIILFPQTFLSLES